MKRSNTPFQFHISRPRSSTALCLAILVSFGSSAHAGRKMPLNSTPPEISNATLCSDQTPDSNLRIKREDFCKLTNSIRVWHLSHTLKLDSDLNEIAQVEAKHVFDANKEVDNEDADEDDSTDINARGLLEKIKDAGLEVGELGFHISTSGLSEAHDVIRNSMSLPTPRKKFLAKSYRKVGIGFYHGVWISLFTD